MTYKKMIEGVVERDCVNWVEQFITKKEVFALGNKTTLKIEGGTCYFDCEVRVYRSNSYVFPAYYVGGTISEFGTVYKSVIRNDSKEIVWASTKELRALEGIEDFQIN